MSITAIVIVVAALALAQRIFAGYAPRPANIANLSRAEAAIINAVGEAMFPAGGAVPQSAQDADVLGYVNRYITWHSPTTRFLMHALFYLIEHATLLFLPSWKRMSQLDAATRERYLAGWESSKLYPRRMVFQSLRALMCLAYLGSPAVERAIGLQRPARCRESALVK